MKGLFGLLAGAGIGAGLMFILDPQGGARRRAVARDKAIRFSKDAARNLDAAAHDLKNRASGLLLEIEKRGTAEYVDDDTLVARVRAAIGHVTRHAHAIQVVSKGSGVIELKGPLPAAERIAVLGAVKLVHGVNEIDDDLYGEGEPNPYR